MMYSPASNTYVPNPNATALHHATMYEVVPISVELFKCPLLAIRVYAYSCAHPSLSVQAETTRLRSQVQDLEGALNQARRDTDDVRQVEHEARAREAQALAVAKNVQEQAVVQRAYADELALENDRLAREGADLARMINDKELSEQRLNEHIRNLDANNVKMQKVMYETHARAEQMQLERDSALHRAKDLEDRLNQALHREEALKSENGMQSERLKRYEDALNQLNGWPLVAESTRAIPIPTPPPVASPPLHAPLNPLGSSYAKSALAAATNAQAAANLASAQAAANAAVGYGYAMPISVPAPTVVFAFIVCVLSVARIVESGH